MAFVLVDNLQRKQLYPFTINRAVASIRFGITTRLEWWQLVTEQEVFVLTEDYLQLLYPAIPNGQHIIVDAAVLPDEELLQKIKQLENGQSIKDENGLIAASYTFSEQTNRELVLATINSDSVAETATRIEYPFQLFQWNNTALRADFKLLTKSRKSQAISPTNNIYQTADIFIEEGAKVEYATLNSTTGPIYIGKDAEIWEGAVIRGPFAIGSNAVIKAGAKIYGATTIGPWCAAGGEIKNVIMMGYSNKAHDGYLGDAVVGQWCNFGAGTSNSNVKNSGGVISLYEAAQDKFIPVSQKCGLVMGDYSRTSINSSMNTGSWVGICCNVFGKGLLPKHLHHFSWGIDGQRYRIEKALEEISNWQKMKSQQITLIEKEVLQYVFTNLL
jgi:UDP-N-acetylglucosamine diphosphorylase / glucose-1-phosphate thymidylyltransferase / UDP-N-acetylgalactosamine diphosphorylase / glucosamine-1-phosphate N-acetyltransferase / galactosamine-1-phosphate N-acetyltransferase